MVGISRRSQGLPSGTVTERSRRSIVSPNRGPDRRAAKSANTRSAGATIWHARVARAGFVSVLGLGLSVALGGTVPGGVAVPGIALALAQDAPRDWGRDLEWFEQAANAGNAEAQYRLGLFHDKGIKTDADPRAARLWYERASDQNHGPAQFRLAVMLRNGLGGPADAARAAGLYGIAAAKGIAEAAYNLGVMFEHGEGIEADPAIAAGYYKSAAEGGVGQAAVNLALLYMEGRGVEPDRVAALAWFTVAAVAGTPGAAQARDALVREMRAADEAR